METKKEVISILLSILLCAVAVQAQGSAEAIGGNITPFKDTAVVQPTLRWDGFLGDITIGGSSNATTNATGGKIEIANLGAAAPCSAPLSITGFIFFSNSTANPTNLTAGNLSLLDGIVAGIEDTASATFNTTSTFDIQGSTITNVPTAYTYINSEQQTTEFREGYFNDGAGNLVFAVEISFDTTGYNGTRFDYQAILPTKNTTDVIYSLTADIAITCPTAPAAGGGGGGMRRPKCKGNWSCTEWGACINGLQHRNCIFNSTGRTLCIPRITPSLARACKERTEPEQMTEQEAIRKALERRQLRITAKPLTIETGGKQTVTASLFNPNKYSEEKLRIIFEAPTIYQAPIPLYQKPLLYRLSGAIPISPLPHETEWKRASSEEFRLGPEDKKSAQIEIKAPLLTPQNITATLQAASTKIIRASKPIKIKVRGTPFKIEAKKEKKTTEVKVLIDNRNRKARKANLELNFNKGRKSLFSELYTIELPEDDYALYGHEFRTELEFDTVQARFGQHEEEVKI